MNLEVDKQSVTNALFVIGGFNGLASAEAWVSELNRNSRDCFARAYSWCETQSVRRDIVALPVGKPITLIGHSLGGGCAGLLAQLLPVGTINTLITVAPYAPWNVDHRLTRNNVGYWLNILPTPGRKSWRDFARNIAAPLFLNWREQGFIASASENHVSDFPHEDFYRMMTDRAEPWNIANTGQPR